jgi:hypothetical protein
MDSSFHDSQFTQTRRDEMRRLSVWMCLTVLGMSAVAAAATKASETTPPRPSEAGTRQASGPIGDVQHHPQRFQLFVAPGHSGSPFLLDTATGCVWHQVQNEQTKRTTFVEVDVENLHWSWGSGAQQILASRVDGSNLTDEQKRALKENLHKTGCGLSNVVLTPGPAPAQAGQTPGGGGAPAPSK